MSIIVVNMEIRPNDDGAGFVTIDFRFKSASMNEGCCWEMTFDCSQMHTNVEITKVRNCQRGVFKKCDAPLASQIIEVILPKLTIHFLPTERGTCVPCADIADRHKSSFK